MSVMFPGNDRVSATKELNKLWKEIDRLTRLYIETGREDLFITINGLKNQCGGIMERVQKEEEKQKL